MRRSGRPEPGVEHPAAPSDKESVASVLDAPRPAVTRYRPIVVGGALLVVLLLVGAGFLIAFGGGHRRSPSPDRTVVEAEPAAAPVPMDDRLPATYGELGPDPIAPASPTAANPAAPGGSTAVETPSAAADAATAARRRRQDEERAAWASAPFPGGAASRAIASPAQPPAAAPGVAAEAQPSASNGSSAKEAFVSRAASQARPEAAGPPRPALSPYEVKAGSVIAAALLTGLNADLPGMVVAQVTQPVFDHRTGRVLLIPQGSRLIGKYDDQVTHGQDRVLLVWTRLIFPSGRSVDLGAMTGADATGASGLSDTVDSHLPVLARAVGLSTLITVGGAVAQNSLSRSSDNLVLQDGAGGMASQASQTGQRLVERDLQRAPTLRIRPGFPVRVMVDKDLILPPEIEAAR